MQLSESEHTFVPMSSDKQGSTVLVTTENHFGMILTSLHVIIDILNEEHCKGTVYEHNLMV